MIFPPLTLVAVDAFVFSAAEYVQSSLQIDHSINDAYAHAASHLPPLLHR